MERINKQRIFNFYSRKNKWLGIIDYKTLSLSAIYVLVLFKICMSLGIQLEFKIYIFLNLVIPLFIFIVLNIQEDNIVLKLEFILKFVLNKKIYVNYNPYAYRKIIYMKNVEKHYIEKKT